MLPSPIGTTDRIDSTRTLVRPGTTGQNASFAESLGKALETVEEKSQEANVAVVGMLNKTVDVHDAMIALHEAEEAIELTVTIRNKFVKAYQDIMGMGM